MAESGAPRLAEFRNPPVVETVLSAQFESIAGMGSVHFGLFWARVQHRFGKTEERAGIDPVFERFGPGAQRPVARFSGDRKPGRVWLINEAGTEMIQLQVDRFIKNWRKAGSGDCYPRYERVIRPAFDRDFGEFAEFLETSGLGPIRVNQCEVTYVNHIVSGDGWSDFSEAPRIFSFLAPSDKPWEDSAFLLRYPLSVSEKRVGRLIVEIQPAYRSGDDRPMFVMSLTARGMTGESVEFFDIGRQAIVEGFVELTTPMMHEIWGVL